MCVQPSIFSFFNKTPAAVSTSQQDGTKITPANKMLDGAMVSNSAVKKSAVIIIDNDSSDNSERTRIPMAPLVNQSSEKLKRPPLPTKSAQTSAKKVKSPANKSLASGTVSQQEMMAISNVVQKDCSETIEAITIATLPYVPSVAVAAIPVIFSPSSKCDAPEVDEAVSKHKVSHSTIDSYTAIDIDIDIDRDVILSNIGDDNDDASLPRMLGNLSSRSSPARTEIDVPVVQDADIVADLLREVDVRNVPEIAPAKVVVEATVTLEKLKRKRTPKPKAVIIVPVDVLSTTASEEKDAVEPTVDHPVQIVVEAEPKLIVAVPEPVTISPAVAAKINSMTEKMNIFIAELVDLERYFLVLLSTLISDACMIPLEWHLFIFDHTYRHDEYRDAELAPLQDLRSILLPSSSLSTSTDPVVHVANTAKIMLSRYVQGSSLPLSELVSELLHTHHTSTGLSTYNFRFSQADRVLERVNADLASLTAFEVSGASDAAIGRQPTFIEIETAFTAPAYPQQSGDERLIAPGETVLVDILYSIPKSTPKECVVEIAPVDISPGILATRCIVSNTEPKLVVTNTSNEHFLLKATKSIGTVSSRPIHQAVHI